MDSQIEVLPIVMHCGEKQSVAGFYVHSVAAIGILQKIKRVFGFQGREIKV